MPAGAVPYINKKALVAKQGPVLNAGATALN